jgi:hypothetical protein
MLELIFHGILNPFFVVRGILIVLLIELGCFDHSWSHQEIDKNLLSALANASNNVYDLASIAEDHVMSTLIDEPENICNSSSFRNKDLNFFGITGYGTGSYVFSVSSPSIVLEHPEPTEGNLENKLYVFHGVFLDEKWADQSLREHLRVVSLPQGQFLTHAQLVTDTEKVSRVETKGFLRDVVGELCEKMQTLVVEAGQLGMNPSIAKS